MKIKKLIFLLKSKLRGTFNSNEYHMLNQGRLEHLASLNLDLTNKSVLEVGAGIGHHSTFWIDRNCNMLITEGREKNVKKLRKTFPNEEIMKLDLDEKWLGIYGKFDIVYCYGLLYHLGYPANAINFMFSCCKSMLLLETCVSFGKEESINLLEENKKCDTQSVSGIGCRPTRAWIFKELKKHFEYVYIPTTQPTHKQFPLSWDKTESNIRTRAVFIASRKELNNKLLVDYLPDEQYI